MAKQDFIEEANLDSLAGFLSPRSSFVDANANRRVSRASFNWFQEETSHDKGERGLIGTDGNLRDEYIMKRQSINKPQTLNTLPMLVDLSAEINSVDGWILTQLFVCGYAKMQKQVNELNRINVFPIADGDTGANMKVCLKLPTRNLILSPSDSILTVSSNMAADVLLNGQGNSGTILSHFFVSLAEEVHSIGKDSLSIDEFTSCLVKSGLKMNDAVPTPVEGTLLSVCRDSCSFLDKYTPYTSLKDVLLEWNQLAQDEVAKTPDRLTVNGEKVLEKAGVVDAGAQGWAYFVEGMVLAMHGELPEATDPAIFKTASAIQSEESVSPHPMDHTVTDSKFQFCTEAVVVLKDCVDPKAVTDEIEQSGLGDSIATVTAPAKEGGQMVKLHIHSNDPDAVFCRLIPHSKTQPLKKEKVEDMFAQREAAHSLKQSRDLKDAKFTIVGMSALVLPSSEMNDDLFTLPVFMVPSTTQEPIDLRFTTDADTCTALNCQRHQQTAIRYTTAASNPMQIKIELLAALRKGKPVLVFLMSKDKRVSALGRNVMAAIDMLLPEQQAMIKVLVHGWGFYEGNFLLEAIKCAREGKTIDEAFASCEKFAAESFVFSSFVSSKTVKKLLAWRPGLFPEGFSVDQDYTAFGLPPLIRTGEPLTEFERVSKLMTVQTKAATLSELQDLEVGRIKDNLKPGQQISSLLVQCVGRPDHGHSFVQKLRRAGIPLLDEPLVHNMGFFCVATSSWGEFTVTYKIVES